MWRNKAAYFRRLRSAKRDLVYSAIVLKLTERDGTRLKINRSLTLFAIVVEKIRKNLAISDQSAHSAGVSAHSRDKRSTKAQPTIIRFEGNQNYVRIPWHLCVAASTRRPCCGLLAFSLLLLFVLYWRVGVIAMQSIRSKNW